MPRDIERVRQVILPSSTTQGFDDGGTGVGTAIINIPITGAGTLATEGSGQLYLYASNSYTPGAAIGYSPSGGNPLTGIVNVNQNFSLSSGPIWISYVRGWGLG